MENGKEASGISPSGPQPRMPRWTRREILALVRAKHDVEGGGGSQVSGRGRRPASSPDGGHVAQSKWAAVAEGCRVRGVKRGSTQCRKRWTNLIAAFRKIKNWETERGKVKGEERGDDDMASSSHMDREQKGYWEMGGEERKEKGLPGRFDKVVYEIMEGKDVAADVAHRVCEEGDDVVTDSEEEEEAAKPAPPAVSPGPAISVIPISMRRFQLFQDGIPDPECGSEKQPDGTPEQTLPKKEGTKRKRSKDFHAEDVQPEDTKLMRLTETLERGTRLVAAQLEAQTIQLQMDRDQRKEQFDGLLKAFNRLADGVMKIAEKIVEKEKSPIGTF